MPTEQKRKKKRRSSAPAIVIVTVLIVAIGLLVMHGHKQNEPEKSGFATSETVSETGPLGSFASFETSTAPVDETDLALPASTTAGQADTTTAPMSNAPSTVPETTATTNVSTTTATTNVSTTSASTAASTIAATTTTRQSVGTTIHNYGEGADYAYAYAGFTPKQANMNAQWNLLLVNRDYILPQDYSPDLSEAVKGSGVRLDSRVSPHYQEMYDAAKKDGITLTPLSGHRRISTQKTNFENKIQKYVNQGYDRAEATRMAAKIILPPGTSEHNAGLAMDIISLDVDFEQTKAFKWLQENAQDYGFILRYPKNKENITQITYEPWHWRYVGVTDAKAIKQSGQSLEEYLGAV